MVQGNVYVNRWKGIVEIMRKYRAAIVGCGAIFPMHAVSVGLIEDAVLECVCDIDEEKAKAKAEEYGCKYYTDYKEMIQTEKPDVVHVCLPHYLHAPVSIFAMENGADVICEKPMAMNVEEAEEMLACSKRTNKKLGIIFQNRYNDVSKAVKAEIDSGKLGELVGVRSCVNWHRDDKYYSESSWRGKLATEGGGVVVNQAIHTFDLMLWLAGKKVLAVDANVSTRNHDIEVEDSAEGVAYLEGGACASFWYTNYYAWDMPVEIELVFENGRARVSDGKGYITYNGEETKVIVPDTAKNVSYGNAKGYWGSSHSIEIADFYEYVRSGRRMFVCAEDAFETHKAMCALLNSGREKRKIIL